MGTNPDALLTQSARASTHPAKLAKISAARAAAVELADRVTSATQAAIRDARESGMSWHEIGESLGVTRQRAQQLAGVVETKEAGE